MKVSLLLAAFVLTVSSMASAQGKNSPTVAGGPHDLSAGSAVTNSTTTETCIFCHAPHGGNTKNALWNRTNPAGAVYTLYKSSTSVTGITDQSLVVNGSSGACLSCHDGSVAMDVLANGAFPTSVAFTPKTPGNYNGSKMKAGLAFLDTDLQNDHPVAINYKAVCATKGCGTAAGQQFKDVDVSGAKITVKGSTLPLFGDSAAPTVECASCHNAHDNTLGNFLRVTNAGSGMCLSCHTK